MGGCIGWSGNRKYEVPACGRQAKYGGNKVEIDSASLREIGLEYEFLFLIPELARIISSVFQRYF